MKNKKSGLLLLTICGLVLFFSRCINTAGPTSDPRGNMYAGAASCRQCHKAIYDAYLSTTHYNTTYTSSGKNVLGSFHPGHNTYAYDSLNKVVMEQRDSGLFQVLYVNGKAQEAHRMDIGFGLKHAQTFLFWEGNKTFELPVSYYTSVNAWASSPGFPAHEASFRRFIGKNCFECHSSFIDSRLSENAMNIEEVLDKKSLLTGIDCERCHGPSINHVNYHLAYPDVREAKYMVTGHSLTRQQQMDACAVCHSGNDKEKEISTFKFKLGDTLAHFFLPWAARRNKNADPDVHGNQCQLLAQTKCFLASKTLSCTTCHNPHTNAGNDLGEYAKTCISCHAHPDHRSLHMDEASAGRITSNCIDCHMPEQPSRAITFQLAGSHTKSAYLLRTHRIAIYPDAATKHPFRN